MDDAHFPSLWSHITGRRVLEVGCGTGRHTGRLVAMGNRVTAIEPSEGMMAIARTKMAQGEVEFIHANFLSETQIPSGSFDTIIVSLVLEHIGDVPLFFQKAAGHLKPSGQFYLSEIHPERIAGGSQAHFCDESTGQIVRLESFPHTASAIGDAAKAAGFVLLETRDVFGSTELSALHPGWEKYLGKPMIKIWAYEKP